MAFAKLFRYKLAKFLLFWRKQVACKTMRCFEIFVQTKNVFSNSNRRANGWFWRL